MSVITRRGSRGDNQNRATTDDEDRFMLLFCAAVIGYVPLRCNSFAQKQKLNRIIVRG